MHRSLYKKCCYGRITHQSWAERQAELTGIDPLLCKNRDQPLTFAGMLFGNWQKLQDILDYSA